MRVISFSTFKENCKHFERNYEFNKDCCQLEHGNEERFYKDENHDCYYSPCKEKYCPILQKCTFIKGEK